MIYRTLNPANGVLERLYELSSDQTIERTLQKSVATQSAWQSQSIADRAVRMRAFAADMIANSRSFAEIMAREMGKPLSQGEAEIEKSAWLMQYYADNASIFLADDTIKSEHQKSYVCFEPLGVILSIMPWNFPFWQVFRFAIPALMAGNSVILKHAQSVPECAIAITDLFAKHEIPCDRLFLDERQTGSLMADRRIAGV